MFKTFLNTFQKGYDTRKSRQLFAQDSEKIKNDLKLIKLIYNIKFGPARPENIGKGSI